MSGLVGRIRREPDVPALDGRDLSWLVERYLVTLRQALDEQATVDGYGFKLAWFTRWWETFGPERDWLLRPDDLLVFQRWLKSAISERTGKPLSFHSRNDVLRRLRAMFRWAHARQYTTQDYGAWVPKADGGPPVRRAARVEMLLRLLEAAGAGPHPGRDRAILGMLIGMGLRRAEVAGLNVEDVVIEADQSGYVTVLGKRTRANPTGRRAAAFDAATGHLLVAYLDASQVTAGPLFCSRRGVRLTSQGLYKAVKRAIRAAGLEGQIVGPHDLRRAFATFYARERPGTTSADLLRRQLGHASYSQTSQYSLLEVDDIRADLVSPLADLGPGVGVGHCLT